MKKSLIALAAVAFVGSAFAQDAVTLYGRISVDYTKFKGGKLNQGNNISASRIGFKGKEAIADGTNVVFKFEHRFDNITQKGFNPNGGREVYLGLESDSYGSIYFGRKDSLSDDHVSQFDLVDTNAIIAADLSAETRVNRSVTYFTPEFAGFQFGLQTSSKNRPSHVDGKYYFAATAIYDNADLGLDASVTYSKNKPSVDTSTANKSKGLIQAGVGYDFEVAKVTFDFENNRDFDEKKNSFIVAVKAPIGESAYVAANLGFGGAYGEGKVNGKKASVLGAYSFSKRTTAYAGVGYQKAKSEKNNQITFGVVHNF